MVNELALGWSKLVMAGIGTVFSGLVLYYVKRVVDRKDFEEERHVAAHKRYERNFLRISEHSDVKLEIEAD